MPIMFQVVDKFNDEMIKGAFRFKAIRTDTAVFRLYYKLSIWFVGIYSLFHTYITFKTGISCMGSHNQGGTYREGFIKAVEDYCWSAGTYSVRKAKRAEGQIYPGVGGVTSNDDFIIYHHYYKWMYFLLLFKILSLYFPRYVWGNIECGLMKQLCSKIHKALIPSDEEIKKELDKLVAYFDRNLGNHHKYAYGLILCEMLNVFVASALLTLWDFLTGHELSLHAASATFHLLNTPGAERNDPLTEVFPIIGKCTFARYGPSGNQQTHDFLCVLPINVVNERAAVIFWYYFMVLIAVGLLQLIYRLCLVLSSRVRRGILKNMTPISPDDDIDIIIRTSSYSDWYILTQFGSNVEPIIFRQIVQQLVIKQRYKLDLWQKITAV